METGWLAPGYELIAELLLHPDDREEVKIRSLLRRLEAEAAAVPALALTLALVRRFVADPGASSRDEYVQTLELSPPCPLYLGAYLFDEPTTCRGIATSGRNAYMLELSAIYRHFGCDLSGRELPDYLPALVEFSGDQRPAARVRSHRASAAAPRAVCTPWIGSPEGETASVHESLRAPDRGARVRGRRRYPGYG